MNPLLGTRIGPYEVLALLGAGGMGEVYRARDSRLGRDVALKVLPSAFTADPDRLRRFEQEARAAGQINHPGIVAVYDVGLHRDTPYLVSELLEGVTLRARLNEGPLSTRKAIDFALQIARGLAAAHAKGVVHRDVKPENLFITTDGRAKVLDFGLAKLKREQPPSGAASVTQALGTETGVVLGTVGYMSPEQVRGEPADHRSDIFSLGAILYEMLAGRRPFRGESAVETMNAILKEDVPELVDSAATGVPRALSVIITHCLEKHPSDRFQSAHDLAFDLEMLATFSSPHDSGRTPRVRMPTKSAALALVLLAVAATVAALVVTRSIRPTTTTQSVIRFDRLTDFVGLEESPALSPDGKSVAFTGDVEGRRQLWVRLIAGGPPLRLTRDPIDHLFPRWSPDSSSIVYFSPAADSDASGALWEVSALGGAPRRIAGSLTGADVSHDGKRLAFFRLENGRSELVIANRDGSGVEPVATLEAGFIYQTPRWSPDDRRIAYERQYLAQNGGIFVIDLDDRKPTSVFSHSTRLAGLTWLPDGSGFVFSSARGSTIPYLPKFQLWAFVIGATESRQLTFGDASYLHPDVRADGTLVASRLFLASDIWRFPTDGSGQQNVARGTRISLQTGDVRTPSVSPDDRQVVFLSDSGGHGNLWVTPLPNGEARQITFERDPAVAVGVPVWSPRDDRVVFYSQPLQSEFVGGYWQVIHADGSSPRRVIQRGWWTTWSPDGRWLYYQDLETVPSTVLKKIPIDGGPPTIVRTDGAIMPALSADGGTLYFAVAVPRATGTVDYEIRTASPENARSKLLAWISGNRVADASFHPTASADGEWLALPLTDGVTSNVWGISTRTGALHMLTDFGQRPTFITRRVSWSFTSPVIYAAIGEGDADIVLIGGLIL